MSRTVSTFLMFEGAAEEAMTFYVSLFRDSRVEHVDRYGPDGPGKDGSVKVAHFTVAGHPMMCSDSFVHHAFTFTPSMSLFVECADAAEQEEAFGRLGEGGHVLMPLGDYGFSQRFGWVADRFGVSWQLNLSA